jgi:hypothetical protein
MRCWLVKEALRLLAVHVLADGHQALLGHQLPHRLGRVAGEAHVAVGENPDQLAAVALDHRDAGDAVVGHEPERVGQRLVRVDGDRVDDDAGLELLDRPHLVGLASDLQVLVDHAHAPGLRHDDGEGALCHRVHGGRDQGNAEPDLAGEAGLDVGLGRQHGGPRRDKKNVVEGEAFAQIHAASPCGREWRDIIHIRALMPRRLRLAWRGRRRR